MEHQQCTRFPPLSSLCVVKKKNAGGYESSLNPDQSSVAIREPGFSSQLRLSLPDLGLSPPFQRSILLQNERIGAEESLRSSPALEVYKYMA